MSFRRPPALANWLLERFAGMRNNAVLAGDLLEDFRNGRSAGWYWRQSLGVIANAIGRNAIALRWFLPALGAGYAAQAVVTLELWRQHFPAPMQGGAWIKFGVWVAAQFIWPVWSGLVNRVVAGTSSPNLRRMYCAADPGTPRSTTLGLAAYQSFALGLGNYGLCALIFPRFSPGGLVGVEIVWFVLWVFAPALAPAASRVSEAETAWVESPKWEPSLEVVLTGGGTVMLEPQSLAQSIFVTADPELIAVVFGKRRSLEILRRAVWCGVCRNRSCTPAELDALIDETGQGEPIVRAEGFVQRLRLVFRGDPA